MKSIITVILVSFVVNIALAQNHVDQLKAVNDYLISFSDGYYGYLEVQDGYLYDRFKSGEHSKVLIKDLDKAVSVSDKKVIIKCKKEEACVFSTYTDSYHKEMSFSQSTSFNTEKLISLLNDLVLALNDGNIFATAKPNTTTDTRAHNLRDSKTIQQVNTLANGNNQTTFDLKSEEQPNEKRIEKTYAPITSNCQLNAAYATELTNLNDFLRTFNPSVYRGVEVKDNMVFFKFAVNRVVYNSSISIEDLTANTLVLQGKSYGAIADDEIKIVCKNNIDCFYSEYTNDSVDHFRFFTKSANDLPKMKQLLDAFILSLR